MELDDRKFCVPALHPACLSRLMPPVSPRCTEEPLVEPLRTAVSAETAKSGHTIHPVICRSDEPELVVVVAACVGHGEAFS